jgi:hypothetical protein
MGVHLLRTVGPVRFPVRVSALALLTTPGTAAIIANGTVYVGSTDSSGNGEVRANGFPRPGRWIDRSRYEHPLVDPQLPQT